MKIWLNGRLVDRAHAVVNVFDHGLLYGDGVFEGIRVYNGRVFHSQAHLDRLYVSAKQIRLAIPYPKQELHEAMVEAATDHVRLTELNAELAEISDQRAALEDEWLTASEMLDG